MISHMRMLALLLLAAAPVCAQDAASIAVLGREDIAFEQSAVSSLHETRITFAFLEDAGWAREEIPPAVAQLARILGQCGVKLKSAELVRIAAPSRFRDFLTPVSRQLAEALQLAKPTVYFVAGTRQRPAFDAEAIGRGNSRTRPELADTVWITRGTRDLGIALAHELAHVLMDSGEHSGEPGNLMREDTAPGNTRLSDAQCAQLRSTGSANGLLKPP